MTLTAFPPPDPGAIAGRSAAPPPALTLPPRDAAPSQTPSLPRAVRPASPPPDGPSGKPKRAITLILVLAGLAILMVLIAVAALPVLQDDKEAEPTGAPGSSPSQSLELRPQPSSGPAEDPAAPVAPPAPSADEPATAPEPAPAAPVTSVGDVVADQAETPPPAVEPTPEPAPEPAPPEVPESKAVVRGGQIFLEGAVPTAEAGELIAALAAEILGPDNVFNNYIVDPRASDPNLGNVTVEDTINFATGSAVILPEGEGLMNQALALMTIRPSVTVIVVGHTDSRGSDEYNLELSRQRAESVKTWLTDRGIDGSRIDIVGKGEAEPLADNATAEGQRINRRIQFFIENLLADS